MDSTLHHNKVSVIVPTYNRAQFLPNAVKTIINQEYDNIEIIIVDDGSTDNTQTVVNSLQKEYSCMNRLINFSEFMFMSRSKWWLTGQKSIGLCLSNPGTSGPKGITWNRI